MVLCDSFIFFNGNAHRNSLNYSHYPSSSFVQLSCGRKRFCVLVPKAKKKHTKRRRSWWQRFFLDDDGNWLGLKDEDMVEDGVELESGDSSDGELSENEKFEAWKRRAEAIVELREAQEDARNEVNRRWEDWLADETDDVGNGSSWIHDSNGAVGNSVDEAREDPTEIIPRRGLVKSVRDAILGPEEDDILYEDRVFRYASFNSVSAFTKLLSVAPFLHFIFCSDVLLYLTVDIALP